MLMITQPRPAKDETMTHNQTAPLVGVVIVNWNRSDDTLRCLASLRQSDYGAVEIVVIDNASTDDSVAADPFGRTGYCARRNGTKSSGTLVVTNAGIRHFWSAMRLMFCCSTMMPWSHRIQLPKW